MKQILLILLLFLPGMAFSQLRKLPEPSRTSNGLSYQVYGDYDDAELVAHLANMNYCLMRYHRGRRTARWLGFSGLVFAGFGAANGDDPGKILMGVGGAFGLFGCIVGLASERWLGRATIEPTRDGASFVFRF
jgi:hypothetical protein